MRDIQIYAEYLLNLGQITVFASLPSKSTSSTEVTDKDGKTLTISHAGDLATIALPAEVSELQSSIKSQIGSIELSFRFHVKQEVAEIAVNHAVSDKFWTASSLTPNSQVACSQCGNEIVRNVSQWKDLPSGNWADMMDLWHCHKPSVPGDNGSSAGKDKGYAASNTMNPAEGCGLVSTAFLMFRPADCVGTEVSEDFSFLTFPSLCLAFDFMGKQEGGLSRPYWPDSGKVIDTVALKKQQDCRST
ncbi:uncharacterized protein KY384_004227 [Bacidia gigantensis]|uniref:uncharacterized protein n=1 Tax=Bacidia gigantensis TaxID=2732470 RepID=UPI001D052AAD|nr:uncharacterized protein KY384_004227 [Bacidia gigantensis]KAG8530870.1 hypothetical protein KY384_004227 [Bacidia gigantensis]